MKKKVLKIFIFLCILYTSSFIQVNNVFLLTSQNKDGLTKPLLSEVPLGLIALWSGSIYTIPSGWVLCNGSNGTPDLRNRFILSVGNGEVPGATGGTEIHNHTYSELPRHTHGVDDPGHNHNFDRHMMNVYGVDLTPPTTLVGAYDFPIAETGLTIPDITLNNEGKPSCQTNTTSHLPPFYELAFIMKTSPSNDLPQGIIIMVDGTWEEILDLQTKGWTYCNGWNGTPDLCETALASDNKFIRMVNQANPGSVGGNDSHKHSYSDLPQHAHTLTNPGHTHNYGEELVFMTRYNEDNIYLNVYDSFQTSSVETKIRINHTGSEDCKTHLDSIFPPYFELAFLMKTESDAILPLQTIMLWRYGLDTIPLEWYFCNGSNGTPNITNRFIRSSNFGQSTGNIGGNSSHIHRYTNIPRHNHSKNESPHSHSYSRTSSSSRTDLTDVTGGIYKFLAFGFENPSTSIDKTNITVDYEGIDNCKTDLASHLPPYYKLAFIQYQSSPEEIYLISDAENPDYDGSFELSWNAPSYTDFYNIYEYTGYIYGVNESIRIDTVFVNNSYSINKASSGVYYYRVVAVNQYGSSTSECINATVDIDSKGQPNYIVPILILTTTTISTIAISFTLILYIRKKKRKLI